MKFRWPFSNKNHRFESDGQGNVQAGEIRELHMHYQPNSNAFNDTSDNQKNIKEVREDISYLLNRTEQFDRIIHQFERSISTPHERKAVVANLYGPASASHMAFVKRLANYFCIYEFNQSVNNKHLPLQTDTVNLKFHGMKRILCQPNLTRDALLARNDLQFNSKETKTESDQKNITIKLLYFYVREGAWAHRQQVFQYWINYWAEDYSKTEYSVPIILNCVETTEDNEPEIKAYLEELNTQYPEGLNTDFLLLDKLGGIRKDHVDDWVYEQVIEEYPDLNIDQVKAIEMIEKLYQASENGEMAYLHIRENLLDILKECTEENIKFVKKHSMPT